jgi:hypothetical protein
MVHTAKDMNFITVIVTAPAKRSEALLILAAEQGVRYVVFWR